MKKVQEVQGGRLMSMKTAKMLLKAEVIALIGAIFVVALFKWSELDVPLYMYAGAAGTAFLAGIIVPLVSRGMKKYGWRTSGARKREEELQAYLRFTSQRKTGFQRWRGLSLLCASIAVIISIIAFITIRYIFKIDVLPRKFYYFLFSVTPLMSIVIGTVFFPPWEKATKELEAG